MDGRTSLHAEEAQRFARELAGLSAPVSTARISAVSSSWRRQLFLGALRGVLRSRCRS